jgi:valyl-tRNA synthetase
MQKKGLIEKVEENYQNRVGVCYKCGTEIEPLPMEQWFIKVGPLAKNALEAVKKGEVKIYPQNFTKTYYQWLENIKDWNISRQIVWGMQIPAWRCLACKEWVVTEGEEPKKCSRCAGSKLERDPDVFDTWFSSGQWPYATLQTTKKADFEKFYPTSVMETGRDILFFWVARMIMLGIYSTGKAPFRDVVLHGTVLDPLGKKMSKSRGNVVNPIEIADQYGADAARLALVYGTAFGHDQTLSHPKLQAMRNFTNKIWNIGRFIIDMKPEKVANKIVSNTDDKWILEEMAKTCGVVTGALEKYRFNDAAEELYEFIWHKFADKYIEMSKNRREDSQKVLETVFEESLRLLHPFMPFLTEELWQRLPNKSGESIMTSPWPTKN